MADQTVPDSVPAEAVEAAAEWFSRWMGASSVRKRDREYAREVLVRAAPILVAAGRAQATLPDHLRGDGPCRDCGTPDNIIWFTDNAFWNRVMGGLGTRDDPGGIVCIPCFVTRADAAGFATHWRLQPDWHWETKAERAARRAAEEAL